MKKVACTVAQTIYRKHKAGRYDKTVVRCSECGHAQESSGSGDGSVRRCLALLKQSCPRGERNFYEVIDEDSSEVAGSREFVRAPGKSASLDALLVTEALFKRIMEYTASKKLLTSWYDHGNGVNRQYTLKYCLQSNYHQSPKKFYIKRGGRQPPELWYTSRVPKDVKMLDSFQWLTENKKQILASLDIETPSYESLCNNIMRKYPEEVLHIYRKPPSSGCDFGTQ